MPNENLVIWTTDWHLVSNDAESAGTGQPTTPSKAVAVVTYINDTLDPLGCIDTGDNKDHYGATGTEDEHDNYITYVQNELRWLTVNPLDENGDAVNATFPNLPGNHDEYYDSDDTGTGNNDFSPYDAKFWGSPYHWTADWDAPRIRFIAFHAYIHHEGTDAYPDGNGFFHLAEGELEWIENELANLPDRYQAILCCHPPVDSYFGNNIKYIGENVNPSGSPPGVSTSYIWNRSVNTLLDLIATYQSKVVCVLGGHRHTNWQNYTVEGVPHITAGGMSYGAANGYGCFVPITYNPSGRTLTFDVKDAAPPYDRITGFAEYVISLQPNRLFIAVAS